MATTLTEYLKENPPGEFRSVPHYFPSGDYLTYFVSDEPCFAKRIDDVVTVYLANGSERLVGCKVKGVKHILRTAGEFRVEVQDGDVKLGFFFVCLLGPASLAEHLGRFAPLFQQHVEHRRHTCREGNAVGANDSCDGFRIELVREGDGAPQEQWNENPLRLPEHMAQRKKIEYADGLKQGCAPAILLDFFLKWSEVGTNISVAMNNALGFPGRSRCVNDFHDVVWSNLGDWEVLSRLKCAQFIHDRAVDDEASAGVCTNPRG